MIYQPAIFVKGFPDARVSSSVILVYSVTIRLLHFAHAQSICTRPLDQIEVWLGDKASTPSDHSMHHLHSTCICVAAYVVNVVVRLGVIVVVVIVKITGNSVIVIVI